MNKSFYGNLAVNNIKKNSRGYIPYMLTCTFSIMVFYIMMAIVRNPDVTKIFGGETLKTMLLLGAWVIGFFSAIFLFYTNSFLIKQRKKELALYNILGMAKRHVGKVFLLETLITSVISLVIGILGGIVLGKLFFLLLLKIVRVELPMEYQFSAEALAATVLLFGAIFCAVLLCNLGRIQFSNPMELLAGGRQGEKEPKTKWILVVIGLAATGIGYYMAITVVSPLEALAIFFVAVILVIIGTYLLFIAGSIALLKLLRKNKTFYYKTAHFTSVSGMLYRMKRNAAGLASICILSTMVLVTVSTTVSMQVGVEGVVERNFPNDIQVNSYVQLSAKEQSKLVSQVERAMKESHVRVEGIRSYPYLSASGVYEENSFYLSPGYSMNKEIIEMHIIPIAGNKLEDLYGPLGKDEVIIGGDQEITSSHIKIGELQLKVKDGKSEFKGAPLLGSMAKSYYLLVADEHAVDSIVKAAGLEEAAAENSFFVGVDINENDWNQAQDAVKELKERVSDRVHVDDRQQSIADFRAIYGGLLFVGIFLGLLFLMATVLIIYYKQITEGYEDSERYKIMQKVGMSLAEVKKSIKSQILIVFFLPLIVAVLHTAAAFNMMSKLLIALQISDIGLFLISTGVTILIFTVIYIFVYSMTAREYYKLVR